MGITMRQLSLTGCGRRSTWPARAAFNRRASGSLARGCVLVDRVLGCDLIQPLGDLAKFILRLFEIALPRTVRKPFTFSLIVSLRARLRARRLML